MKTLHKIFLITISLWGIQALYAAEGKERKEITPDVAPTLIDLEIHNTADKMAYVDLLDTTILPSTGKFPVIQAAQEIPSKGIFTFKLDPAKRYLIDPSIEKDLSLSEQLQASLGTHVSKIKNLPGITVDLRLPRPLNSYFLLTIKKEGTPTLVTPQKPPAKTTTIPAPTPPVTESTPDVPLIRVEETKEPSLGTVEPGSEMGTIIFNNQTNREMFVSVDGEGIDKQQYEILSSESIPAQAPTTKNFSKTTIQKTVTGEREPIKIPSTGVYEIKIDFLIKEAEISRVGKAINIAKELLGSKGTEKTPVIFTAKVNMRKLNPNQHYVITLRTIPGAPPSSIDPKDYRADIRIVPPLTTPPSSSSSSSS